MPTTYTVQQLVTRSARRSRKALPALLLYLKAAEQANYPDAHIDALKHLVAEMEAIATLEDAEFDIPKREAGRPPTGTARVKDFTRSIFLSVAPKKQRKVKARIPKVIARVIAKDFTEEHRLAEEAAASIPAEVGFNAEGQVVTFDFSEYSAA
jgi:hypothetical protein